MIAAVSVRHSGEFVCGNVYVFMCMRRRICIYTSVFYVRVFAGLMAAHDC